MHVVIEKFSSYYGILMIKIALYALLIPVSMIGSLYALFVGFILYGASWTGKKKLTIYDFSLAIVFLYILIAYNFSAEDIGKSEIISQSSSYIILLMMLRFFNEHLDKFLTELNGLSWYLLDFLLIFYIAAQLLFVTYEYEISGVEICYIIKCIFGGSKNRLYILSIYFFTMAIISTRSTPLFFCIFSLLTLYSAPWRALRLIGVVFLLLIPLLPYVYSGFEFITKILESDDNGNIRIEMIQGAGAQLNLLTFFSGIGFGTPFRDSLYAYEIGHPLLTEISSVYKISNHNSLYDLFLRLGVLIYYFFIFRILSIKLLLKNKVSNVLFFMYIVIIYSLFFNAYLDSTKLTIYFALMLVAPMYVAKNYREKIK